MSQDNYALLTRTGRLKEAQRMAGQSVPAITRMAFGDMDRSPTGGETALGHEVHRADLTGFGVYPDRTAAFFDCYLPANVGGWVIREVGLIDAAGYLVAIARRSPGLPKTTPESGGGDDFTMRLDVFFEDLDTLVVQVSPIAGLTADNLQSFLYPNNLPVDGHLSLPPGSPIAGGQYLIAANPTGAWAGKAGQLARFRGAWSYEVPRAGRVVTYMSGARLMTLRFDGTNWADWAVTLDTTAAPGPAPSSLHPQVLSHRWRGAVPLPAGTDLDTVRTGGQYLATTPTHAPGDGDWIVEAIPSDSGGLRGHQVARKMGAQEAWHRYWIDGPSFSGWRRHLDTADITTPRFDLPAPGFFYARATAGTPLTPNTWTKVSAQEEVNDQQGWYNPTTSRFQPTKAGIYLLMGACGFGSGADNPTTGARIYLNGVVQNGGFPTTVYGAQYGAQANGSASVAIGYTYFNGTTDFAELFAFKTSNQAGDYTASNARFSGHFIGVLA